MEPWASTQSRSRRRIKGGGGRMASADHIPAIKACFGCGEDAAHRLAAAMGERQYEKREPIALCGDTSNQLFLVIEGSVVAEIFGIDGQQAQLARHGPGEIFGAYPDAAIHRADITASSPAMLLSIPTKDLASLAQSNAQIGAGVAGLLARQLDLMLDRMASRIGLSANGRFHKALLQLADGDGMICPAPVISALALSVNTTRETGSRALAALLRRGIMERQGEALRIVSRRMLEEMVV
jgi:CRP/FNR family transcriptional regulator, cyclic AMP receptor protein